MKPTTMETRVQVREWPTRAFVMEAPLRVVCSVFWFHRDAEARAIRDLSSVGISLMYSNRDKWPCGLTSIELSV